MPQSNEQKNHQGRLETLTRVLEHGSGEQIRRLLHNLQPAETAHLLESFPVAERDILWRLIDSDERGEILIEVNDEVRAGLIRDMEDEELVAATEGLDTDDLADLIIDLPRAVTQQVLQSMDQQDRHRLESVLSFPEDTAGGLMNTDAVTVRQDVSLDVVLRYLRLKGEIPELTDNLIVVNRFDRYLGLLPLTTLLTLDPEMRVGDVMNVDIEPIPATLPAADVAKRFEDHDLVSAPVVDENGKLLGRITVDDVVDVIRDQGEHSIMSMAGLDEEDDIFAPVVSSARRRAFWLGINLFTALLASRVIGLFEATLEQVVALAVLMPVVASMGGIAGSQTLTIMIRGLALGQIGDSNARWLMLKEISVGLLNGIIWALVVAAIAVLWFQNYNLGVVIAIALVLNLCCAALAGFSIPMFLHKVGIDPALAGTVLLTTVTDVVGFLAFLGLGTLYLL